MWINLKAKGGDPTMATPNRLQGKTVRELREMARTDAQEVLAEHWPGLSAPVDPIEIARDLGASVFTAQLGDDVYGMVRGDASGANIYVDRDSALVRQRFTIAHELGHVVSYKDEVMAPGTEFVDARSDKGAGTASEIYANEFAGELLMPRAAIELALEMGINSSVALADRFQVSLQAMAYRRQLLGV